MVERVMAMVILQTIASSAVTGEVHLHLMLQPQARGLVIFPQLSVAATPMLFRLYGQWLPSFSSVPAARSWRLRIHLSVQKSCGCCAAAPLSSLLSCFLDKHVLLGTVHNSSSVPTLHERKLKLYRNALSLKEVQILIGPYVTFPFNKTILRRLSGILRQKLCGRMQLLMWYKI